MLYLVTVIKKPHRYDNNESTIATDGPNCFDVDLKRKYKMEDMEEVKNESMTRVLLWNNTDKIFGKGETGKEMYNQKK